MQPLRAEDIPPAADSIQPLRAEDIPPAADSMQPFGLIWMRKEQDMAKNLLLEYLEELATKCELLCQSIKC